MNLTEIELLDLLWAIAKEGKSNCDIIDVETQDILIPMGRRIRKKDLRRALSSKKIELSNP